MDKHGFDDGGKIGMDREYSGDQMRCPGCGYETVVFDGDDHNRICPECGIDALLPVQDARKVALNREWDGNSVSSLLSVEDPTEGVSEDALDALGMGARAIGVMDDLSTMGLSKSEANSRYGASKRSASTRTGVSGGSVIEHTFESQHHLNLRELSEVSEEDKREMIEEMKDKIRRGSKRTEERL